MSGLAGIGYQSLRLARPDRVPCLATLEPPCGSRLQDRPGVERGLLR
jgi:hypothetical protein